MARISNLEQYNTERATAYRIDKAVGESILLTDKEIKTILTDVLGREIEGLVDSAVKKFQSKLNERIEFKIRTFETTLMNNIDDKINRITETIVGKTTNRIIEAEVNRRVDARIEKIKNIL